ncbi:hypothetical protein NKH77_47300 [Streptomyces sp. M19]
MNTRAQLALMHPLGEMNPVREMFGELLGLEEVGTHLVHMMSGSTSAIRCGPPTRNPRCPSTR